ncbi:hypothetical protein JHS3_22150 [Jeongeupia sp. HS-3]|uniref:hypothetical protein n=1 Tax=Jeongeupia sp. HS-3 TaxID=1009682 RepID=UPI0018A5DC19|nr:hypothetical protein [Jeongeupia sp. HS-3]BCL76479.1 hypothetical protein JHS3_22150 [Jeongeupia sp. HS-3]
MKTLKLTAVALALAAVSTTALASRPLPPKEHPKKPPVVSTKTSTITDKTESDTKSTHTYVGSTKATAETSVKVEVSGDAKNIKGDHAAAATVDAVQKSIDNTVFILDPSNSELNYSGNDFQGNLGANSAAGIGNQQNNSLAIASTEAGKSGGGRGERGKPHYGSSKGIATAAVTYEQNSELNDVTIFDYTWWNGVDVKSELNHSFNGFQGNGGGNSAAGVGNQQGNYTAIASVDNGVLAVATTGGLQLSDHNKVKVAFISNKAELNNSANCFTGSAGLNSAAGIGNQQVNTLAIASAR